VGSIISDWLHFIDIGSCSMVANLGTALLHLVLFSIKLQSYEVVIFSDDHIQRRREQEVAIFRLTPAHF